jgi:hypothetical protein
MKVLDELRELAQPLRVDSIGCRSWAGSIHPISSMSAAEPPPTPEETYA